MTYGSPQDPFGGDPFGGRGFHQNPSAPAMQSGYPPAGPGGFGAPQRQQGQVNALATLSIVFAFVFAPVGAVLGHLALHQIQRTGEQGRERAIIGLAVSYAITTILVIALVVWLVLGGKTSDAPQAPAVSTTASAQAPRTTVITAPPVARPTVNVGDLRVGDCVEVKKESRDKDDPNKSWITIYRAACEVRDGVAQVQQILPSDTCGTTLSLVNNDQTIFACLADFKG